MREISDNFRNGLLSDMVKLGTPGWRKRYYKYKFSAETEVDMENTRKEAVEKYTEGICWVLLYYFSGVASWTWFYPLIHYGPFASDFKGLSSTKVTFQRGSGPLKPFDQLMSVLPLLGIAHALPPSYGSLMTTDDSSILDFYPNNFDVDTDGKRFLWQGICKLPSIDEERLLASTKMIEKELIYEEEAKRNAENPDKLFLHISENLNEGSIEQKTGLSGDINGFVHPNLEPEYVRDSNGCGNGLDVLCVYYDSPCFSLHIPRVLEGTSIPEPTVSESDIEEGCLWHESHGYPVRSNRSHGQVKEAKINPNQGNRFVDATRTPKEQKSCASWWNTYGRGSRTNNVYGQSRSVRSDSSSNRNQARGGWGEAQSRNASCRW
ncbi:hypothetical protein Lser_V15G14086 [Lactuca serriola]